MKRCLLIGNGLLKKIDQRIKIQKYDDGVFFSNNINLINDLNIKNSFLCIQDFTLNFPNFNDEYKYVRYKKALCVKEINNNVETILIGDKIDFFFTEYRNLILKKKIGHKSIVRSTFRFFGIKFIFQKLSFINFLKICIVYLGFKKKINSNLRPSSGFYVLINYLNDGYKVDTLGIGDPTGLYTTKNVNIKKRAHVFFDSLIFNKILSQKDLVKIY